MAFSLRFSFLHKFDLIDWFCVQTFQPLIEFYRRGIFVYHHWDVHQFIWPLSYPFRSLFNKFVYTFQESTRKYHLKVCVNREAVENPHLYKSIK